MNEPPPAALLARCDAMLARRVPPGLLSGTPRLRWIQALTGGVEGWLALPDLPAGVTLTCARGTHRVQMTENTTKPLPADHAFWITPGIDGQTLLEAVGRARGY